MAFAFNAALIKTEEDNINEKPKVNKDNLINLFKPTIAKTKDSPSEIANIHANLKEENEEELAQFYQKEVTPVVLKTSFQPTDETPQYNPLLVKMNHILELLEEQKEIKTNQKNEEIILYCFLGLFIIYIIDSFVSIGKYSR